MTVHRFYAPQLAVGHLTLDLQESAHAARVLRLRPRDAVTLIDGRGARADARVYELVRTRRETNVVVEVSQLTHEPPPAHTLRLVVAGCKGDRLEWLVEKCTELGVSEIVLSEFERSIVRASETRVAKLDRVAIEACKQSGRAWKPAIRVLPSSYDALDARVLTLLADPSRQAESMPAMLGALAAEASQTQIVIGPEGGLTPDEHGALIARGAKPVRLAREILRIETAAVAAAAVWAAWRCGIALQSAP